MTNRYYVFSNIHGELDELVDNFSKIHMDLSQYKTDEFMIISLGDLIDYGDYSRGAIDYLVNENPFMDKTHLLLGDHEFMLMSFLNDIKNGPLWLTHGGMATLASYEIECEDYTEAIEELHIIQQSITEMMPQDHLELLNAMPACLETDNCIFMHTETNTSKAITEIPPEDFVWAENNNAKNHKEQKLIICADEELEEIVVSPSQIVLPTAHTRRKHSDCFVIEDRQVVRQLRNIGI